MKKFVLMLAAIVGFAGAQMLPNAKPVPTYMADSEGKPLLMDFSIPLVGMKDPNMPFSVFSQRPLMVYYFSPHCPHCQKAIGSIQALAKKYEQSGLTSIAVSVGSVNKRDVLMFMEQYNASIPYFQDAEMKFGKVYGDGYVPRLYLISSDGKVVRYTDLEESHLSEIGKDIEKLLGK